MGTNGADLSRKMYDENKRYQMLVYQQGKPLVDADFNDAGKIAYNLLRRFIQTIYGDGSPNDGFQIVGYSAVNNFTIKGGDGTLDGAGRILIQGHQAFLPSDRNYKDADNLECTPVSVDLSETVLTDTAANFTLGGGDDNLIGRTLVPDITQPAYTYSINANTQTTITVTGSMLSAGIEKEAHYRVELSTPSGSDRTDEVYLDCYLDEIDGDEDEDIEHTLGMKIETQRRMKLIQNVFVAQGATAPNPYVDFDANQHYILKLATLERYDGVDDIYAIDLTDDRHILYGETWTLWSEVVVARGVEGSLDERIANVIPAGSVMAFFQAAAPYGWTQVVTHDDKMLRVVSGAGGGSGGTGSPLSHYHSGGGHVLTIDEMPSHDHSITQRDTAIDEGDDALKSYVVPGGSQNTDLTGGGQAHSHGDTDPWTPKYIDMILCSKD